MRVCSVSGPSGFFVLRVHIGLGRKCAVLLSGVQGLGFEFRAPQTSSGSW